MHAYDRRQLKRLFGLSSATIRFLERSGYLPSSDRRVESAYEFRDLLLLRAVSVLHAAKLPTRTINRALRHLKPWLSERFPMNRVAWQVSDERISVREGPFSWDPGSGQYALPLEVESTQSHILPMKKRQKPTKPIETAHAHYLRGADLEEDDAQAAKAAYQACLKGDCSHLQARINLGRLLHLEGKHREAESIYRDTREPDAILFFNLGVLLEDLGSPQDAMAAYRDAIVHDPGLADAHFNLALLHERVGETQAAFRHLLAYRRLMHVHDSAHG